MDAHLDLHRRCASVLVTAALLALAGCRLHEVKEQVQRIDSAGMIAGRVITQPDAAQATIVTVFHKQSDTALELYRALPTTEKGTFALNVAAGDYYVAAFVDRNGDGRHQQDEPGAFYGAPTTVSVAPQDRATISIHVDADSRPTLEGMTVDTTPAIAVTSGTVAKLDDARFDPANYSVGLWRPLDFLANPGGGLYMLGEYQPDRVPVIFVHGMGDGPRRWQPAVDSLDRNRFQPWVLYYPTGLRLEAVSNYFSGAVHELRRRYGFAQFAVVAHSMGGLVTRSFVQRLHAHFPDDEKALRIVITVNSPQGGMASATTGVEYSPIVIPSWQDVAAGSEFLKALDARGWPKDVPYHLVFSYDGEKNGDGTVALASQIPVALQSDAMRLYGFEDTHTSTLADERFLSLMNRLLAESVAARPAATQPSWFDDWLGRWTGPEGTYLELARHGDSYAVVIQSLDGSAHYEGRAVTDHIEFKRDGKVEAIRATGGPDTGMKWLADKSRCLTIRAGEGFCR